MLRLSLSTTTRFPRRICSTRISNNKRYLSALHFIVPRKKYCGDQHHQESSRIDSRFQHTTTITSSSSSPSSSIRKHVTEQQNRSKSSAATAEEMFIEDEQEPTRRTTNNKEQRSKVKQHHKEIQRLKHIRNVGVFAHVDAGKTTVTERMLALAGVIRRAGNVDDGNTVTDFLPQERERGITIQSAAVSFEWGWHNNNNTNNDNDKPNDNVTISLIDTPGHIDFSVEVNRSVAVLDGAVLVVDAVAGVQAQTETVWRAMTTTTTQTQQQQQKQRLLVRPTTTLFSTASTSTRSTSDASSSPPNHHHHHHHHHQHNEPLPCLALINKMDKDGCNFWNAVQSVRDKLPGANPVPIQIPLFRKQGSGGNGNNDGNKKNVFAIAEDDPMVNDVTQFAGVVDLLHMRTILWPDMTVSSSHGTVSNVEDCIPEVISLINPETQEPYDPNCHITKKAIEARYELTESLAEVDETIESLYLTEQEPSNAELRVGLRRATISQRLLPVMMSAALKGKGTEPVLDAIADLLPSPLDRMPPALNNFTTNPNTGTDDVDERTQPPPPPPPSNNSLGHPLNSSLLAIAFKLVFMKNRGGSGDGRVVFARVYSGELRDRDTVQVVSPPSPGELPDKPRTERVGGMLELAGGEFGNLQNGVCKSGDVCALIGLKSVVTGDTLIIPASNGNNKGRKGKKKKSGHEDVVCLAGVSSPKPVLTVRVEAETTEQQAQLSEALALLTIEDPSLVVEETESATLLSGLGELHIEVTLDRLSREFGLQVMVGPPSVTYRESLTGAIETNGLVEYDRTIGGNRLQGSVHLVLEPTWGSDEGSSSGSDSACMVLADPVVTLGEQAREFLEVELDDTEEDLVMRNELAKALVQGCQGALKRGPLGPYALANVRCHVVNVDGDDGLAGFQAFPGALRAAAANAVAKLLNENSNTGMCTVLEPTMSIEVTAPNEIVGNVLSDLTSRRGTVGDVVVGEDGTSQLSALIRGDVPLSEILGYANSLRSLTGGEGAFTAEYKGHSPTNGV